MCVVETSNFLECTPRPQKTSTLDFEASSTLTPSGWQQVTLHPKAERDTETQNSSILNRITIASKP